MARLRRFSSHRLGPQLGQDVVENAPDLFRSWFSRLRRVVPNDGARNSYAFRNRPHTGRQSRELRTAEAVVLAGLVTDHPSLFTARVPYSKNAPKLLDAFCN